MEKQSKRIQRFQNGPPLEVIETLLNSIDNHINNELRAARKNQQIYLIVLGVHAVALTISEVLFNLKGPKGYKTFLEQFIDGNNPNTKFSTISDSIHDFRNNIAHQWLSKSGYAFGIDTTTQLGWHERNGIIYLNPFVYDDEYLKAFSNGGKIWDYDKYLTADKQESAKVRIIEKYLN